MKIDSRFARATSARPRLAEPRRWSLIIVLLGGAATSGCWAPEAPLPPIPPAEYPHPADVGNESADIGQFPPDVGPRPSTDSSPSSKPGPSANPGDARKPVETPTTRTKPTPPAPAVPSKVLETLEHVDARGQAPDGYQGGRSFHNSARQGEQPLPRHDSRGRTIRYREWDVNPKLPGINRGAERLITGSDGSAYFTDDHYRTFSKIR